MKLIIENEAKTPEPTITLRLHRTAAGDVELVGATEKDSGRTLAKVSTAGTIFYPTEAPKYLGLRKVDTYGKEIY